MSAVVKTRNTECPKTPLLVKIAPDLTDAELKDVCNVVMSTKVCVFFCLNVLCR